jgi:FKBP-type peptidyl-prolyl cis-trans isomerase FklB
MTKYLAVLLLAILAWGSIPARAADEALSATANHAYLAANARKPGVMVRPSGLQYRILRNGFGAHPTASDTVQISYSAHLINAKLVDTASADLPAVMLVNNVLRGLNEALQLMQTGDHWELVIPPDLAFGSKGTPDGNVPPGQTLVFDITLMSVTPAQVAQGQARSGVSLYGRERGVSHEAGAMFTIPQ